MSGAPYILEEGALRRPHGPRPAPRLDDRRRPHLSDHARAHGHHRRERRRQVRHLARGAGRVRGREPGRRRARPSRAASSRTRSSPSRFPARKKGETIKFETDEHPRPDTHDGRLGDAQARVQAGGRLGHGGQRVGHQRRRRGAGRHVGREGEGARPHAARHDPRVRVGRRRSVDHGHGPVAGVREGAQEGRPPQGRDRPLGAERGVRGAVARRAARAHASRRTA